MMNSKQITQKEYEAMSRKVNKLKYKLSEYKKKNKTTPKQTNNVIDKIDTKTKLDAMNTMIGYLVRKGHDSGLPMNILIEIANDYDKELKKQWWK